jgi:hypothetical protein
MLKLNCGCLPCFIQDTRGTPTPNRTGHVHVNALAWASQAMGGISCVFEMEC